VARFLASKPVVDARLRPPFWLAQPHGPYRARAQSVDADGARARNRIEANMTECFFDHDRLDVCRLSIDDVWKWRDLVGGGTANMAVRWRKSEAIEAVQHAMGIRAVSRHHQ